MKRWVRVLNLVLVVGAATAFAVANGGQRVDVDLGLFTLRAVSLPAVVFLSILLGMVTVLLAGLRGDLRTRETLQRYRRALDEED